jgi:S-adenosylmethionine uptake transporter
MAAGRWLLSPGYAQGATWAILTCLVSILNDVITKMVGTRLHSFEIGFFRYLFSMLTVLPFMIYKGKAEFYTKAPGMHFLRAVFGVAAIALYILSLVLLPLAEVTTFSFTQPLFFMPLAVLFLRERVKSSRWIAAIIGFLGIIIVVNPQGMVFNYYVLIPMASAFLFACLDLLAKKMVVNEKTTTLLFYFALGTTLVGAIPAAFVWQAPTMQEVFWMVLLGSGANLIQVCLFRAFSATEASSLAPFRYVELVFSILFGFMLFGEIPTFHLLLGAMVIIASTLYLSYFETWKKKRARA